MPGYAKLFSDIVDSSIWDEDPATCKVWVTLLALSDQDGFVRGSPGWLAGKARVTVDQCVSALEKFKIPDARSRTADFDGRRVEQLSDGWLILNYIAFRDRLSPDSKAVATRERVRKHRDRYKALRNAPSVTPPASASASVQSSVLRDLKGTSVPISLVPQSGTENGSGVPENTPEKHNARYHKDTRIALHWLNDKGGRHYREVDANLRVVSARLSESGVTLDGVKQMIERQVARWKGTPQEEYLRPETLFAKSKFDGYYAARELPIEQARNGQSVWELNKRAEHLQELIANHRANPDGIYGGEPTRAQEQDFVNLTSQLEQLKREIATHSKAK